ncbi:thiosulfate:glutathione sulfurtransferase [Antennarius striatus]|uniref:thiosulfate:glutathione sulfurtransferase n=1 Tax=Antennarius striatus TaxID=241820 RepID=UPI0035B3AD0A
MLLFADRCRVSAVSATVVSIMLSLLLSRNVCRVVAELSRTSGSVGQSLVRSVSNCAEQSDSVVTYSQLASMLSSGNVQLYDVRTPDEYQAGYIADAVNMPVDTVEESLKLAPVQFQEKFAVTAPGKNDDNIVFYCRSGKRSATALGIAHQLGFCKAKHLGGGYIEWEKHQGL